MVKLGENEMGKRNGTAMKRKVEKGESNKCINDMDKGNRREEPSTLVTISTFSFYVRGFANFSLSTVYAIYHE